MTTLRYERSLTSAMPSLAGPLYITLNKARTSARAAAALHVAQHDYRD